MEYVGMVSVYFVLFRLFFSPLMPWPQALAATVGMFFLFLGLKKKTRDHLSGSFLLFAVGAVVRQPLAASEWAVPFLLCGATVRALEGYLEKRQKQVFLLPLIYLLWARFDDAWLPGLLLVALYLTYPWAERPGLRRRLAWLVLASTGAALLGWATKSGAAPTPWSTFLPVHPDLDWSRLAPLIAIGVPTLSSLAVYWRELKAPHLWATVVFALLAPWDPRLGMVFAMVAAVLLAATVFQLSIDSDRLRPLFKHAEWHFFWYVLVVALWTLVWPP